MSNLSPKVRFAQILLLLSFLSNCRPIPLNKVSSSTEDVEDISFEYVELQFADVPEPLSIENLFLAQTEIVVNTAPDDDAAFKSRFQEHRGVRISRAELQEILAESSPQLRAEKAQPILQRKGMAGMADGGRDLKFRFLGHGSAGSRTMGDRSATIAFSAQDLAAASFAIAHAYHGPQKASSLTRPNVIVGVEFSGCQTGRGTGVGFFHDASIAEAFSKHVPGVPTRGNMVSTVGGVVGYPSPDGETSFIPGAQVAGERVLGRKDRLSAVTFVDGKKLGGSVLPAQSDTLHSQEVALGKAFKALQDEAAQNPPDQARLAALKKAHSDLRQSYAKLMDEMEAAMPPPSAPPEKPRIQQAREQAQAAFAVRAGTDDRGKLKEQQEHRRVVEEAHPVLQSFTKVRDDASEKREQTWRAYQSALDQAKDEFFKAHGQTPPIVDDIEDSKRDDVLDQLQKYRQAIDAASERNRHVAEVKRKHIEAVQAEMKAEEELTVVEAKVDRVDLSERQRRYQERGERFKALLTTQDRLIADLPDDPAEDKEQKKLFKAALDQRQAIDEALRAARPVTTATADGADGDPEGGSSPLARQRPVATGGDDAESAPQTSPMRRPASTSTAPDNPTAPVRPGPPLPRPQMPTD